MASQNFDVVVIGGGNAALVAALSAHEAGAHVAILEAAPRSERGGNSRFASAVFRVPHGGLSRSSPKSLHSLLCDDAMLDAQRCTVQAYTPEAFVDDMMTTTNGRADRDLMDVVLKHGYDTCAWMRDQGVRWKLTVGKFFDQNNMASGTIDLPPGVALMAYDEGVSLTDDLWAAVEKTSIEIFYQCPAFDLLVEGDRVRGIRARQSDYVDFYGQIILGCGGFEASPRLRRQYLGQGWDLVVVRGTRFNTGTMLEKAIHAGAQATGHWGGAHASPQDLRAPKMGDLAVGDKMSRYSYPFSVMVNINGKRFINEGEADFSKTYAKTGAAISEQPGAVAYQIFDQKTLHTLEPRYHKTGKPVMDETLAGLASKLGINVQAFLDTIREFNTAVPPIKPGHKVNPLALDGVSTNSALRIPKSNWALPIDSPPYHAYGVTCGITFTYGGLKVDRCSRVLNNEDAVMPGLWAIGEMSGGYFYHNYPGGAGLVKGAVFGRIAGQGAAREGRKKGKLTESRL